MDSKTTGGDVVGVFAYTGPSPAETDALAWAAVAETDQRKRNAGARGLSSFALNIAHKYETKKADAATNIIDQGKRKTYNFGVATMQELFRNLEICRLEKSTCRWSERQGIPTHPSCGIMLDYDIVTTKRRPELTSRHCYRIASALIAKLQADIDFGKQIRDADENAPSDAVFHMFFIVKPEALPIAKKSEADEQLYKFGFHILIPGIQINRSYKKWFLRNFRADPGVASVMREMGVTSDTDECLDMNSASVPVLFFGSCKYGSIPYTLGSTLEITIDISDATWSPPPAVKVMKMPELLGYNLVAEMSLVSDADYSASDGRKPLVHKRIFKCREEISSVTQDWGERTVGNTTAQDQLILVEHDLSTLTMQNAEARHMHALLDILGPEFHTDRNKWRNVIFALANTNSTYKPLAIWFSHKCPHNTTYGTRSNEVDQVWDDAIARRGGGGKQITYRSILYWARNADEGRFFTIMNRSYFTMLMNYIFAHGGRIDHYMIAKILYIMLGAKFCVDLDVGARGIKYCWYEFVIPGQSMKDGEVWKWRREHEPDDIHIYMSEKLPNVFDQAAENIAELGANAGDEDKAKYYANLGKQSAMSKLKLYNNRFKNSVVAEARFLFRRRGFAEKLDADPLLFGTLNGVLQIGHKCVMVDHFHEHAISKFSPVAYTKFNPAQPTHWQQLVLDAIADIIVEPDARDWIMYHAAQGLSGEPKEGLMLLWEGGGQNGKTSFLRWVAKSLGPYADKFNIQLMCCDREDADKPNSAMMRFKHVNYAYSEESNKSQTLNVARMKEMVNAGEVSGRELHGVQETFTMKANLVAASQYSFKVNTTDHGTWRRLRQYTSKAKFRMNPDPGNPFEKKDDQRFVRQYPSDPHFQSAFLSILVHYYERLQAEYGGQLKNVKSPTIERETEEFRIGQDSLHRWVCESIVKSPDCEVEYSLGSLGMYYTEWYNTNIEHKRQVAGEILKEIEASAIGKYLRPAANRTLVLKGCRVLVGDEMALRAGEELLIAVDNRGIRTAEGWALELQGVSPTSGRKWWEGPSSAQINNPIIKNGNELLSFNDDGAMARADRTSASGPGRRQWEENCDNTTKISVTEEDINLFMTACNLEFTASSSDDADSEYDLCGELYDE